MTYRDQEGLVSERKLPSAIWPGLSVVWELVIIDSEGKGDL